MPSLSRQPASVSFKSADRKVCDSFLTANKEAATMIYVVPSSLHSASLRLKQNCTFCPEDLLFDTVTCPRRHRGILLLRFHEINDTVTSLVTHMSFQSAHVPIGCSSYWLLYKVSARPRPFS